MHKRLAVLAQGVGTNLYDPDAVKAVLEMQAVGFQ